MSEFYQEPFRVSLLGARLHNGNRGVTALTHSLIQIVTQVVPDAEVSLLLANRTGDVDRVEVNGSNYPVRTINYRLSPFAPPAQQIAFIVLGSLLWRCLPVLRARLELMFPWIAQVVHSNFIGDIRAGDSFSDIYGLRRLLTGSLPALICNLLGRKITYLPQTFGPFQSAISRQIARFCLRRSEYILTRDPDGIEPVVNLLLNQKEIRAGFCPDVAFMLDPMPPEKLRIEPDYLFPSERSVVGINVNGLVYNGGYTRRNMFGLSVDYPAVLRRMTQELLRDPKVDVILIAHTFAPPGNVNSDEDGCAKLRASLSPAEQRRVYLVSHPYNQNELKWIISRCAFFVGTRMHACIGALSQGIPTVGLAYSKKFAPVFATVGVPDSVIDLRSVSEQELIDRVLKSYSGRISTQSVLERNVQGVKIEILRWFRVLLSSARLRQEAVCRSAAPVAPVLQ